MDKYVNRSELEDSLTNERHFYGKCNWNKFQIYYPTFFMQKV